ncbi:hypothetical protein BpHYR1_021876 [Brachionus plicatilis]|uniref:Uncharacterized protein n=1 Tax=Brachionus plicatilis TaxID=10195 RepID=A0A3M7T3Z7_BRAPC|nr:hypothetical protein BpHYR1_021876 [Brachionus plicatilis]
MRDRVTCVQAVLGDNNWHQFALTLCGHIRQIWSQSAGPKSTKLLSFSIYQTTLFFFAAAAEVLSLMFVEIFGDKVVPPLRDLVKL